MSDSEMAQRETLQAIYEQNRRVAALLSQQQTSFEAELQASQAVAELTRLAEPVLRDRDAWTRELGKAGGEPVTLNRLAGTDGTYTTVGTEQSGGFGRQSTEKIEDTRVFPREAVRRAARLLRVTLAEVGVLDYGVDTLEGHSR